MEANLLHQRLTTAIHNDRDVTLLLRGAHRLSIANGALAGSEAGGETRFDITGLIAVDGTSAQQGTVSVTSSDVASIFVRDTSTE